MENKRPEVGDLVLIKGSGFGIARVTARLDRVYKGSKILMVKLISPGFENTVISTSETYLEKLDQEDEDLINGLEEIGSI